MDAIWFGLFLNTSIYWEMKKDGVILELKVNNSLILSNLCNLRCHFHYLYVRVIWKVAYFSRKNIVCRIRNEELIFIRWGNDTVSFFGLDEKFLLGWRHSMENERMTKLNYIQRSFSNNFTIIAKIKNK